MAQPKAPHEYSARNALLIYSARPDASQLAGYRQWQTMGRQVRKGERGIVITAPVTKKDDDGKRMVNVRTARVFDIAQTDPIGSEAANEHAPSSAVVVPDREPELETPAVTMVDPFGRKTTLGCAGCDHPGTFEHDARCTIHVAGYKEAAR